MPALHELQHLRCIGIPCRNIAEILDSDTVLGALQSLLRAYVGALHDIVLESYLSLVVVMLLLLFCYAIAKAGVLES
eukprot:365611-Chlamydomonas_euryale.AAC.4